MLVCHEYFFWDAKDSHASKDKTHTFIQKKAPTFLKNAGA